MSAILVVHVISRQRQAVARVAPGSGVHLNWFSGSEINAKVDAHGIAAHCPTYRREFEFGECGGYKHGWSTSSRQRLSMSPCSCFTTDEGALTRIKIGANRQNFRLKHLSQQLCQSAVQFPPRQELGLKPAENESTRNLTGPPVKYPSLCFYNISLNRSLKAYWLANTDDTTVF